MPQTAPLRLVGGNSTNEGRLEIHYGAEWFTICDEWWDSRDATVACKQLGFMHGQAVGRAHYGQGTGRIGMSGVRCNGTEAQLIDCPFWGWFPYGCRHSDDAGVVCSSKSFLQFSQI